VARFLGVEVVLGGAADGLRLGRFDMEARRITIADGYPAEAQATELCHQLVHALTPAVWRQGVDCERDRCQDVEQVAESAGVLLGAKLGWDTSDRDVEHVWSLSVTEARQQELLPYVNRAVAELSRGIGL
jgi:hypothetical protein